MKSEISENQQPLTCEMFGISTAPTEISEISAAFYQVLWNVLTALVELSRRSTAPYRDIQKINSPTNGYPEDQVSTAPYRVPRYLYEDLRKQVKY